MTQLHVKIQYVGMGKLRYFEISKRLFQLLCLTCLTGGGWAIGGRLKFSLFLLPSKENLNAILLYNCLTFHIQHTLLFIIIIVLQICTGNHTHLSPNWEIIVRIKQFRILYRAETSIITCTVIFQIRLECVQLPTNCIVPCSVHNC